MLSSFALPEKTVQWNTTTYVKLKTIQNYKQVNKLETTVDKISWEKGKDDNGKQNTNRDKIFWQKNRRQQEKIIWKKKKKSAMSALQIQKKIHKSGYTMTLHYTRFIAFCPFCTYIATLKVNVCISFWRYNKSIIWMIYDFTNALWHPH